jgi:hypothetical protein
MDCKYLGKTKKKTKSNLPITNPNVKYVDANFGSLPIDLKEKGTKKYTLTINQ